MNNRRKRLLTGAVVCMIFCLPLWGFHRKPLCTVSQAKGNDGKTGTEFIITIVNEAGASGLWENGEEDLTVQMQEDNTEPDKLEKRGHAGQESGGTDEPGTKEETKSRLEEETQETSEPQTEEEQQENAGPETEEETQETSEPETEEETQETSEPQTEEEQQENVGPETEEETQETSEPETEEEADINRQPDYVELISNFSGSERYDYRTWIDKGSRLEISVKAIKYFLSSPDTQKASELLEEEEANKISYELDISDTQVISAESVRIPHEGQNGIIPVYINAVGNCMVSVCAKGSKYDIAPCNIHFRIENSPLYDTDFYIALLAEDSTAEESQQKFTYQEWIAYLQVHNGWVNAPFCPVLSSNGQTYYNNICMETKADTDRNTCLIWAEHSKRNASTRHTAGGVRIFEAGIDTQAPVAETLRTESKCYEPTKTETEQYFAQDFVLKGMFVDRQSGVEKIEYTTNYLDGAQAEWKEVFFAGSEHQAGEQYFEIVLPDGCYKAIAVRAYDHAGNVSKAQGFVNAQGNFIKVVVDKTPPRLQIKAESGGEPYNIYQNTTPGNTQEHWTNKDVVFDITPSKDSSPYAGIYQYEYQYRTIQEAADRDKINEEAGEWTPAQYDEMDYGQLTVREDRNGYYYFQAVSKSGVMTESIVSARILIQRELKECPSVSVSGASVSGRKNGWYNKESGIPQIRFVYPDYDDGKETGEYESPITIHYTLDGVLEEEGQARKIAEGSLFLGVVNASETDTDSNGNIGFKLTQDDVENHIIDFGLERDTGSAQDGIYTLKYWMTDLAGNKTEKQSITVKIDCHAPSDLSVRIADDDMPVESEKTIVYDRFYQNTVTGSASAQYGISGKGTIQILKAQNIGSWNNASDSSFEDGEFFEVPADRRCFLYIRAEDGAGNIAEGWTRGIVVDSKVPGGSGSDDLIQKPEGANENGFYREDVTVKINIKDLPQEDVCAALMTVHSTVGKEGADTVVTKELFSFTKELPTDEELTKAASYEGIQIIDAKANESNAAFIEVTACDRAGNTKTSTQILKIDVTKPVVKITFDTQAVTGNYYNQPRTATIHVREQNFSPTGVELFITKDGMPVQAQVSAWSEDGGEHCACVSFSEDGDYTMEIICTDLAGNVSDRVQAENFTIDQTPPRITVELQADNGKTAQNQYFYDAPVMAVITVTEHNFTPDRFLLNTVPAAKQVVWSHDGDIHTARILFQQDGAYQIVCTCVDSAGNHAVQEIEKTFTIDTTPPVLVIEGVMDNSANSGDVLPVITALDLNMEVEAVSVTVQTGKGGIAQTAVITEPIEDESGYRYILTDMTDKEDNIYFLTVAATDMAGNSSELTYKFSLNRKGSAYDLTGFVNLMQKRYNTYAEIEDIVLTEMNIDAVEQFELYISRNGELGYQADYYRQVQYTESGGYLYTYHIKRENFVKEGCYRLSLYSKDRAGNEVNNVSKLNGSEILFIIDNTPPKVIIDGVETGKIYDVESQNISVAVTDNFKLEEAEFTLINKEQQVLGSWDYMEISGEGSILNITVPTYDEELTLLYRVKDAAGNEAQTFYDEKEAVSNFLVTKDKMIQFINNPVKTMFGKKFPVAAGSVMCACAAVSAIIFKKKRFLHKNK